MFQVKNFTSIVAGMINQVRAATTRLTDFNVGSVNRSMIEGVAIEVEELYQQMLNGLVEGIPTALFLAFGFDKLPAAPAAGRVLFSLPAPIAVPTTIPAGTSITDSTAAKTYVTVEAATIQAGDSTASAGVLATQPGSAFNVRMGELNTLSAPVGQVSVTNPAAITTGRDEEVEEARKLRFLAYIVALSRATTDAIKFGAETATVVDAGGGVTERVLTAKVVELYRTNSDDALGYVDVYLWNGATGASATLVVNAQKILDGYIDDTGQRVPGWKAAGIVARVAAVQTTPVNITMTVQTADGLLTAAQSDAILSAVARYVDGVEIGGTVFVAGVEAAAFTVDGVLNATVTAPGADVMLAINGKAVLGATSITAAA